MPLCDGRCAVGECSVDVFLPDLGRGERNLGEPDDESAVGCFGEVDRVEELRFRSRGVTGSKYFADDEVGECSR